MADKPSFERTQLKKKKKHPRENIRLRGILS